MENRLLGCIVGGTIGDALGYEVEFWLQKEIEEQYGILDHYILHEGKALISDDTQMTLFTMEGLIQEGEDILDSIYNAYLDWLKTQHYKTIQKGRSSLLEFQELYSQRAPGYTCLSVLEANERGSIYRPINHSKGCGGIMRVAPIAFLKEDILFKDQLAAQVSALTHGHPLGYIPSAYHVHILSRLLEGYTLMDAIKDANRVIPSIFEGSEKLIQLIEDAITLSKNTLSDVKNISLLGQGWVAEETLAIALYCCLRYEKDFNKAIVASVNHDGDSDSTGLVTGNISGLLTGYDKIEKQWKDSLECMDIICMECKKFIEKLK